MMHECLGCIRLLVLARGILRHASDINSKWHHVSYGLLPVSGRTFFIRREYTTSLAGCALDLLEDLKGLAP